MRLAFARMRFKNCMQRYTNNNNQQQKTVVFYKTLIRATTTAYLKFRGCTPIGTTPKKGII